MRMVLDLGDVSRQAQRIRDSGSRPKPASLIADAQRDAMAHRKHDSRRQRLESVTKQD